MHVHAHTVEGKPAGPAWGLGTVTAHTSSPLSYFRQQRSTRTPARDSSTLLYDHLCTANKLQVCAALGTAFIGNSGDP